jgi:hypothetical protein
MVKSWASQMNYNDDFVEIVITDYDDPRSS